MKKSEIHSYLRVRLLESKLKIFQRDTDILFLSNVYFLLFQILHNFNFNLQSYRTLVYFHERFNEKFLRILHVESNIGDFTTTIKNYRYTCNKND